MENKEIKENLSYVRTCLDKMEPDNTYKVYSEDGQVFAETDRGVKYRYCYGGVMLAVADTLKE